MLVDFYLYKYSFINIVKEIALRINESAEDLKVTIAVGITSSHFEQSS